MKRDFLTIWDLSAEEIEQILSRSMEFKRGTDASKCPLIGKSVGLIFEKPSTRTRVSFEVGIYQLGGLPLYLSPKEIQIDRGETASDTARTLSRYLNGMVLRTFRHSTIQEFARHATVPVINGLSEIHHPCQALADLMTVTQKKGTLRGVRMAFIGDGNNVANSLLEAAARTGMDLTLACPNGYDPDPTVLARAQREGFGKIEVVRDPEVAARGADALYTDVWVSMGQEEEAAKKRELFRPFRIDATMLSAAAPNAIVLHCLPAHRGEEISDEVMDGPQSAVFDQAENRLHTEKAVLEFLIR